MPSSSSIGQARTAVASPPTTRSQWGLAWLGRFADLAELWMQRAASRLAELVGCEMALLLLLPIVLMLRPMLALIRAAGQSWVLRTACVLIVVAGIAAGPSVGTRVGLVLVPLYVLGWTCALKSVYSAEAAGVTRERLARAGRRLQARLVPLRVRELPDRRN